MVFEGFSWFFSGVWGLGAVFQDVLVVFGMAVTGTNPLLGVSLEEPYGFVDEFKIENPWAQRQSLSLCTTYPEELVFLRGFSRFSAGFREDFDPKSMVFVGFPDDLG